MLQLQIEIEENIICNVLCAALESGSGSSWVDEVEVVNFNPETVNFKHDFEGYPQYVAPLSYDLTSGLKLTNKESEVPYFINKQRIMEALRIMSENHAACLGLILSRDSDAFDADIFLQIAAFGKVLYW
jgi:hypothetical protein